MVGKILVALAACIVWGLIFVVPAYMEGFNPIEIALCRYFFYGLLSLSFLIIPLLQGRLKITKEIWMKGLSMALIANIIYYTCVVIGLRYANSSVTALILGISPLTISFCGNLKEKSCSYKTLILPSALILIGLLFVNIPNMQTEEEISLTEYAIGLGCSVTALVIWTWYAVVNARMLKERPDISSSQWSTVLGVTTFFWVIILSAILFIFDIGEIDFQKYTFLSSELQTFLIGGLVLGFACSWVGTYLWNVASSSLPLSLAGQLVIFETIFGLLYIYLVEQRLPPMFEVAGVVCMVVGILITLNSMTFAPSQQTEKVSA